MREFKILPHTADIRLKVKADSLPELFIAATEGMMKILKESWIADKELRIKRIIQVKSPDKTALLVDFMNEVLYQSQVNKEIYIKVNLLEFSETALKAELIGQKIDGFDEDIKAVTYHEANIKQNEQDEWETIIVFDV